MLSKNMFDYEKEGIKRFPIFVDLADKKTVIIGGGNIATKRVKKLLDFTGNITVISPEISEKLKDLHNKGKIEVIKRKYKIGDLKGFYIALATTNDRAVNSEVAKEARSLQIFCSIADSKTEGTFWFPAIICENGICAGAVSENGNHAKVKKFMAKVREAQKSEGTCRQQRKQTCSNSGSDGN